MDAYQDKISNKFWSEFTAKTRRGGEGTTEMTFDATGFEKFMTAKGFSKIPNTMMDYQGTVDGINVTITEKTSSGERGGWIHNWTIAVESKTETNTFVDQRTFSLDPNAQTESE
jgi:hypothetical protein